MWVLDLIAFGFPVFLFVAWMSQGIKFRTYRC
jgi:hypothetical protein